MDVIISAASPQEWWALAKACWVFAGIAVVGMAMERFFP
jgi:hypothetical protein